MKKWWANLAPLQISVSIAELTRSFITESGFKDNSTSIGVSMMYVNGEDYGEGNKNQKYTSVGIGTNQVWKSAADVKYLLDQVMQLLSVF